MEKIEFPIDKLSFPRENTCPWLNRKATAQDLGCGKLKSNKIKECIFTNLTHLCLLPITATQFLLKISISKY